MARIIFIAGVHGVGKGTVCIKIELLTGFPHYSASSLIKSIKNSDVDKNKVVIDASKNQDDLLTAIAQLGAKTEYILIDGHFCLQTRSGIFDIPISTFKGMDLAGILLLTDDISEIHRRLHNRDGKSLDENTLGELQDREKIRAKYIAEKLDVPMSEAKIHNFDDIQAWFNRLLVL